MISTKRMVHRKARDRDRGQAKHHAVALVWVIFGSRQAAVMMQQIAAFKLKDTTCARHLLGTVHEPEGKCKEGTRV